MESILRDNRRSLARYVRNTFWYLKRPQLYGDLVRQVGRAFRRETTTPEERAEATRWCEGRAVWWAEAVNQMTGTSASRTSLRERFKETFARADAIVANSPSRMGAPGSLDLIYWTAEWLHATRVVETGVAYGWSSLAILLSLTNRDGARLISTDRPNVGCDNDSYVGCVVPEDLRRHWRLLRQADREALPKALAQMPSIDLCHYDSDKSVAGREWAYPRLWKAIRPGGCFLSDDVSDNLAFRDFCQRLAVAPIVVRVPSGSSTKFVGVLLKTPVAAPPTV